MDLTTLITQLSEKNNTWKKKIYGTETEMIALQNLKENISFLLLDETDDLIEGEINKTTKSITITDGKFLKLGLSEEAIVKELHVRTLKYKTLKMKT